MSENWDFPERAKSKYDLAERLFDFLEAREKIGQQKYGKGRANAGYRRDNLMDVIEEVTDAITILEFFQERFERVGNPLSRWDVQRAIDLRVLRTLLINAADAALNLRDEINGSHDSLLREKVKRAVPLEAE